MTLVKIVDGFKLNWAYVSGSVPIVFTADVSSHDVSAFSVPLTTGIAPVLLISDGEL